MLFLILLVGIASAHVVIPPISYWRVESRPLFHSQCVQEEAKVREKIEQVARDGFYFDDAIQPLKDIPDIVNADNLRRFKLLYLKPANPDDHKKSMTEEKKSFDEIEQDVQREKTSWETSEYSPFSLNVGDDLRKQLHDHANNIDNWNSDENRNFIEEAETKVLGMIFGDQRQYEQWAAEVKAYQTCLDNHASNAFKSDLRFERLPFNRFSKTTKKIDLLIEEYHKELESLPEVVHSFQDMPSQAQTSLKGRIKAIKDAADKATEEKPKWSPNALQAMTKLLVALGERETTFGMNSNFLELSHGKQIPVRLGDVQAEIKPWIHSPLKKIQSSLLQSSKFSGLTPLQ